MPYIRPDERYGIQITGNAYEQNDIRTPGELNYLITLLVIQYVSEHGLCYQSINDVLGALEGAKLEFVRRVVNPYEDSKIKINGDVYPEECRSKIE